MVAGSAWARPVTGALLVAATLIGVTGPAAALTPRDTPTPVATAPPAALDHLVLAPDATFAVAGTSVVYHAEGYDAAGDDLGDVTAATTFTIDTGSCSGSSCSTSKATIPYGAPATVTGTDGTASGTTTLQVYPDVLDHITLSAGKVGKSGRQFALTANGYDRYGNLVGSETPATTLHISPDGSCGSTTCTPATGGAHTITATIKTPGGSLGKATATTTIVAGYAAPSFDRESLTVTGTTATASYAVKGHGARPVTVTLTAVAPHHPTVTGRTTKTSGNLSVRGLGGGVHYTFTLVATTSRGGTTRSILGGKTKKVATLTLTLDHGKQQKKALLTLSGKLVNAPSVASRTVQLIAQIPGLRAVVVGTTKTGKTGSFVFHARPVRTVDYWVSVKLGNLTLRTSPARLTIT